MKKICFSFLYLFSQLAWAETISVQPLSVNLTNQVTGTLPVASGGTSTTTSTGSGSTVRSISPTITGSPNIGNGTTSSALYLNSTAAGGGAIAFQFAGANQFLLSTLSAALGGTSGDALIYAYSGNAIQFYSGGAYAAKIDTSQRLLVGYTADQGGGEKVQVSGTVKATGLSISAPLCLSTAPTISGFGTAPSVPSNNGTCAFTVNVGTGGAASTGTITLPAATTGWVCTAQDVTSTDSFITSQNGGTTTTATLKNYSRTTGLAVAWNASDVLIISCMGY